MPPRFCSQCGTKVSSGAKFCSECGAPLDGRAALLSHAPAGGWQLTTGGLAVFGLLFVSGLGVWAAILSPEPPKPAPGRGTAGPATAAAGRPDAPPTPVELPPEVKTFMADLAKKAEAAPDDKELWIRLGKVYARAAQLDPSYNPKALAAFEHVAARDPNDREAIRGKADVFYDQGDHKQAIPLFERYLTLAGDDPSARTDLATMYLAAGDGPKAVATYKDVIAKHPTFLQAPYNLAVTYAQMGDKDAALTWFQKARALATDDQVRGQIDQMVARLTGEQPPAVPPLAAGTGAAPPAVAAEPRSPFQEDVEKRLREAPIMGERVVRVDWNGPATARVMVQSFPMEGMPEEVRKKFTERLTLELRSAVKANQPGGDVKVEIADAAAGTVMATVTP
jgi:zinc ribbon protein/tetratricopeptide repeat protein